MTETKTPEKLNAFIAVAMLYVAIIVAVPYTYAQTYTVLYQFKAGNDGTQPFGGVTVDTKRSALYGTTSEDGSFASGTVFKLNRNGEAVLHSFTGTNGDGQYPYNPGYLALDSSGNLSGTTSYGGSYGEYCGLGGCGVVFKVDQAGNETLLHEFSGSPDGATPVGTLAEDASGNLFGVTQQGGTFSSGTVFEVDETGNETIIYNFNPGTGDGQPYGGLVRDTAGNLYGTTASGGNNGSGTVFRVTPSGDETILYSFGSKASDGLVPLAGLSIDIQGNLYGTTDTGGANSSGTVFKVTPSGTETVLYSFGPPPDGNTPGTGDSVIVDPAGNVYGVTFSGGNSNFGVVYKIDPTGKETILHSFSGLEGKYSSAGLARDPKGNLYGTTGQGGAYGGGVIFRITP